VRKAFAIIGALAGIAIVALAILSARSPQASDGTKPGAAAAKDPRAAAAIRAAALKEKAKDEALRFVRTAQGACRDLTQKTEALTLDSSVDFSQLNSFIPPEIYPPDAFGAYVGETTFADVKSQLSQLVAALVDVLRTLSRNQVTSMTALERQQDDVVKEQAALQEKKLKMSSSVAAYCESIRRAGAGIVSLK
jgi:hypothetical protein